MIMATRYLYIARHGDADAFGNITDVGRQQARLLGDRLSHLPITAIWHSPLPRAAITAQQLDLVLHGNAPVGEAPELIDHVPYVPTPDQTPASWVPFFDGYDADEAAADHATAQRLTARFGSAVDVQTEGHEVLITHSYPIAWLLRDALDAPPVRWLGIASANAALTVIQHRAAAPTSISMFNDMSHLPPGLRWTGFPTAPRA